MERILVDSKAILNCEYKSREIALYKRIFPQIAKIKMKVSASRQPVSSNFLEENF